MEESVSITPPALVVNQAAPGLVFLKEKNSAVVIPRLPTYSPIVLPKETKPFVVAVNSGSTGPKGPAGPTGPRGEKGEKGEPGSGGDLHFKFTQGSAASVWVIKHDLEKFPIPLIQDSANDEVEGDYEYPNSNEIVLTFSAPFSGVAYLN